MRAMCEVQLIYRNRAMDLMLMQDTNEIMDQFATASSVHWYGVVDRGWPCLEKGVQL